MSRNGIANTIDQSITSLTTSTVGSRCTGRAVLWARRATTLTIWILPVNTVYERDWIIRRTSWFTTSTLSTVSCSNQNNIADLAFITISRTCSITLNTVGSTWSTDSRNLSFTESSSISRNTVSRETFISRQTSNSIRI